MRFVDLEEARAARGVRLVVVGSVPSPWSEAAKGIFVVKKVDGMLVRFSAGDDAVKQWTSRDNAPVLLVDDEPPRTHWSEILEAAERLGGAASLIPVDPEERARMFGFAHDLLGEAGLAWSQRLVLVHQGLTTEGREGFHVRVARYLAPRYGYAPERAAAAKVRVLSVLNHFTAMIRTSREQGRDYLLSSGFSALDIYLATSLAVLSPLPEEQCRGMHPAVRRAFETGEAETRGALTTELLEHRDFVYRRHLGLPIEV